MKRYLSARLDGARNTTS